jgi:hypothetical protein
MSTSRLLRTLLAIASLAVIAAGVGYAQSQAVPPQDPVVAEIRAMRADLNERLEATIRTQLLVARLQVQEQRINGVVRQLEEINTKLRANDTSKEQVEQGLKMFGAMGSADENPEGADFFLGPLKAGLAKVAKTDADLKLQQSELMGTLTQEQARWSAFNSRLDELEKLFAKPAKPVR